MKPAYSITKKRNTDRLLGTIAGAGIGVLVLYLIKDRHAMVGIMVLFMIVAYTFMRTRYLVFVTFMTPYILILFYLLNPNHFRSLISDRLVDTAIGSAIAYLGNVLLSPAWAYKDVGEYLKQLLEANKNYFNDAASFFAGHDVGIAKYKLSRKEAYVALANISDALNRMLAEPKRKQKNAVEFNQLVVLNYMMASHTATLASIARDGDLKPSDGGYNPVIKDVLSNLTKAVELLKGKKQFIKQDEPVVKEPTEKKEIVQAAVREEENSFGRQGLRQMNERVIGMVVQRKKELEQGIIQSETASQLTLAKSVNDQFNFIWKISEDLLKTLRA